jgi:DNA primase
METLAAGRDIQDPKAKNEIAAQVLPLIDELPSAIERDTYRQRLARLLRVDERTLPIESRTSRVRLGRRRQATLPSQVPTPVQPVTIPKPLQSAHVMEGHALGVLMRRPDLLYQVDRRLQESGLSRLTEEDFQHADHRTILRILLESINQDSAEPLNYVLGHLSLEMMEVADGLLEHTARLDPNDERVLADLIRAVLYLRLRMLKQYNDHLRYLQEDAQDQGDMLTAEYGQAIVDNTRILNQLNKAMGKYSDRVILGR